MTNLQRTVSVIFFALVCLVALIVLSVEVRIGTSLARVILEVATACLSFCAIIVLSFGND